MWKLSQTSLGVASRERSLALTIGIICMLFHHSTFPSLQASDQAGHWTPELMLQMKRVGSVQVSPNGKLVLYTVRSAVMEQDKSEYLTQIFISDVEGGQGWQLTQGEKSCDDPQWSPDGQRIAFVSARSGKKNLWLMQLKGGEATRVSDSNTDISSFKWSPDGTQIAFTAADATSAEEELRARARDDAKVVEADFKLNRLYLIPVSKHPATTASARQLTTGDRISIAVENGRAGRQPFDWSPDGKTIVFAHTPTPTQDSWMQSDISLVDVISGSVRPLVHSGAAEASPLYAPDGQSIVYVASDVPATWGGSRTVRVIDLRSNETRSLADTSDGFGRYSEIIGWAHDGQRLYFTEIHGTAMAIMSLPLNGPPTKISDNNGMSLGGVFLNATRTHLGFGWEQLDRPYEAYVSRVDHFKPDAVSQIHSGESIPSLGKTEIIRWKSTEDFEVEGLLTYPVGYEKTRTYPLLLIIHGGPMGVFTQTFDGTPTNYPVATFAAKGYAVLRVNVRGSSGYGKKFRYANYDDWGGGDYRDLISGVDHVIQMGVADKDRLGVMGWSYGGYMTSWIITQTKRFKAASVGAGVTNLISFTGTADIPSFLPDYFSGEFWDKFETYRSHSPMFHVKGVTTPTLIQHGEKDERVPLSQGQELYNALKRQHCPTKMVIYPRTPHGIEEPRLLLDCMRRNVEWFDQQLSGSSKTLAK